MEHVSKVEITEGGEGYTMPPAVAIEGGGGSGAEAVAWIKNGICLRCRSHKWW